ncbi:MAG TPA: hypothetical protein VFQ77_01205 [Pseudonocardiaceae bacterium]|nr:hypothetical protein [Pseudonocardiaceae bacterium]
MIIRNDVEVAARRIAGHVRRTPVAEVESGAFTPAGAVVLRLEFPQHTGSFTWPNRSLSWTPCTHNAQADPAAQATTAVGTVASVRVSARASARWPVMYASGTDSSLRTLNPALEAGTGEVVMAREDCLPHNDDDLGHQKLRHEDGCNDQVPQNDRQHREHTLDRPSRRSPPPPDPLGDVDLGFS